VKRRLFNLLAALSLLLCMATAALWIRSFVATDYLLCWTTWRGECYSYAHAQGLCWFGWEYRPGAPETRIDYESGSDVERPAVELELRVVRGAREFGGVFWSIDFNDGNTCFAVPILYFVTSFAILPAYKALSYFARKQPDITACCHQCGYDLRATPERCPECGTRPLGNTPEQLAEF